MNVLDLFSGIGGFSLGLERAGMRTVAFCEIDPYCQAVLRKHWPDVPVFGDIRNLTAEALANAEGWRCGTGRAGRLVGMDEGIREQASSGAQIDVICGGFPCQDISVAGKGAGIDGERSGLWSEFARIIGEVRPRYVIVENVAALLGRGIERVLGDLAALGYDAEWHCIPASAVGAPHRRDRVWIVAYSAQQCIDGSRNAGKGRRSQFANGSSDMADAISSQLWNQSRRGNGEGRTYTPQLEYFSWWLAEPDVGRVAHGIPARVDRLRSLGNAIVPQIAEIIGKAIMLTD